MKQVDSLRNKKLNVYLILIFAALFLFKSELFGLLDHENSPIWIRRIVILAHEVLLFFILFTFIHQDMDKRFRIGLSISLFLLFMSRFESNINFLFVFIICVLSIVTIKHFSNKSRIKSDWFKYCLVLSLCLSYLLFTLNIGSQTLISIFKSISAVTFILLLITNLIWSPPILGLLKNVIKLNKFSLKSFIIVISVYVLAIFLTLIFDRFISFKIMDYKFDRYSKYNVEYYYDNHDKFQSIFTYLDNLYDIPEIKFKRNTLYISFRDTIKPDNLYGNEYFVDYDVGKTQHIVYNENESILKNITFLDNNKLLLSYPDTGIIINTQWTMSIDVGYQNQILTSVLEYFNIDKSELLKLEEKVKSLKCSTIWKDTDGNIYVYKNIGGLEFTGYLFSKSKKTPQFETVRYRKLEDSVYWYIYEESCVDFFESYYFNRYNI